MDPVSGAHLMPYPILTDGLKQDHPEWFGDQDNDELCPECGGQDDQHAPDCSQQQDETDDRWGAK